MTTSSRNEVRQQRKAVLAKRAWYAAFATFAGATIAYALAELFDVDEVTVRGRVGRILLLIPTWIMFLIFMRNLNRYQRERLQEDEENRGPLIQTLNLDGRAPVEDREYDELKPL